MAKKKPAHATKKPDTSWQEIDLLGAHIASQTAIVLMLKQHVGNREVLACLDDPQSVVRDFKLLTNDIARIKATLTAIRAKHLGRTGRILDADDRILLLSVSQEYASLQCDIESTILPTQVSLGNAFDRALAKLAAQKAQTPNTEELAHAAV